MLLGQLRNKHTGIGIGSLIFFTLFFLLMPSAFSQNKHKVYLLPGQGADGRLFQKLKLENCDTVIIKYPVPEKGERLPAYAKRISIQIDTTQNFSLIGVSMGGMIAVELSKFLHPQKIIIISSAKNRSELPFRYKFLNYVPLNKLFGGRLLKRMANLARPLVEKEARKDNDVFKSMIRDKHPKFMKRSINCITHWKNKEYPSNIIHIHGEKDKTIPIRNIKDPIRIKHGGHMIVFTHAEEVSEIINRELQLIR